MLLYLDMQVLKLVQQVVWANSPDTPNMAAVYSFGATVTVSWYEISEDLLQKIVFF